MEKNTFNFAELITPDKSGPFFEQAKPFLELMMRYNCAMREVRTKFEVLNDEFTVRYNRNPVEAIKTRLKRPLSIVSKLERLGKPITVESIKENLCDVAGIRLICSFPQDIYTLSGMFLGQDDVRLIRMKDYIKTPKPNGYRSLHLIVEIPIFLTDRTEYVRTEVQFRTIAMDFWASIEHEMKYKKDVRNGDEISAGLKECADKIAELDLRMQAIHRSIEPGE